MKTKTKNFFAGLILISALSSCTMEKRVYMSGYHIEWHKKNNSSIEQTKISTAKTTTTPFEKLEIPTTEQVTEKEKGEVFTASISKENNVVSTKVKSAHTENIAINKAIKKNIKKDKKKTTTTLGGGKSQLVALILCILLGALGIHRFYLGYTGLGILYLFTFGLFGIGLLIDLILLIIPNGLTPKGKSNYRD